MKFLQPFDIDSLFQEPQKKRKIEESNGDEKLEEETKTRCPCPICGSILLEEDINNHLDICLNRSAVLEMVREEDKKLPLKIQTSKGKPVAPKRRRRL
jgi:acetyl-CoA carboxylase beta subunit